MKKDLKVKITDFHQPDPIPKEVFAKVNKILKSANLFRYIGDKPDNSETALLEKDFAEYLGVKYVLALNSCSSAMFLSLICCGVKPGDKVLVPAFTFTAVPSAIVHAGAIPVLVECNERYCINVEDLKKKISPETKTLLLSHMRGHTSDMDSIIKLCKENNITLIEDSAHSLGVLWNGKPVGTYGKAGCYSFQTYKIINAGEGGILVTNDDEVIVKAIYLSGAYEKMYEKHFVKSSFFEKYQNTLPAFNLRMDNISAAIIRPQIKEIDKKVVIYNKNYRYLTGVLSTSKHINIPGIDPRERMAPDSIQFNLKDLNIKQAKIFMDKVREKGISLYVFGVHENNARVFWNWKYLKNIPSLEKTRSMLEFACDMRLPIFFRKSQLDYIANVILATLDEILKV
ncbi:MAG: aminotransferase class I/II-fold pyridoxal phosphate-dependent enzyme [bacterium]|nr:aminotransferase class I/II-fold pyridoxal phosphate-dependent enzyme [bacterium]